MSGFQNSGQSNHQTTDSAQQTVNTEYTTVEEPTQRVEEFKINGDSLVQKIQELLQQGNVRKIIIKSQSGNQIAEIPLTWGIAGATFGTILFPFAAILAGVGVLAARLTIVVEKELK